MQGQVEKMIKDWIPRRNRDSTAHLGVWDSPNHRVFLSVGGDIYSWHLILGGFFAGWDHGR